MAAIRKRVTSWTGADTADGNTRQIVFHVETNSANDGPATVQAYCGFVRGDTYAYGSESDATIRCTNITSQPVDANRLEWIVTVDFGKSDTESNPLNEPAKFSRSQQNREEAFERDSKGKPVRNSAFDRFDDIITREVSRTILRVEKNFASWPQSNYRFVNTVNRSPWTVGDETYRVRQARLTSMSDTQETSNTLKSISNPNGTYYAVSMEFTFAEDDWDTVLLDQGVRQTFKRWDVVYTDEDGKDETIGGLVYQVKHEIVRAETAREAESIVLKKYPGATLPRYAIRLPDGYEPCKELPSNDTTKQGGGKDTQLPMALNGKGRQLVVPGDPQWLEFVGYLEYDFDRFNLI